VLWAPDRWTGHGHQDRAERELGGKRLQRGLDA
jgi:hypothetical protein